MRSELRNIGADTNTVVVLTTGQNIGYPMAAIIRNPGPGTVYIGHRGCTASDGFPLATGESIEVDMVNENMYGVATVTTSIRILRRGDEYGNLPNF